MTKEIDVALIEPNKGQIEGVPKNPRLIKDNKWDLLKKSIQEDPEMLKLREILVFEQAGKFVVIGGNMRFRVCQELGYKTIPCKVIPPETTAAKLKAYTIKDNSAFGEWDIDLLANEWKIDELTAWGCEIPDYEVKEIEDDAKEDDFDINDALKEPPICKPGDIWMLGHHRLICGSASEPGDIDKLMGTTQADLVVTDPPYNVDYVGKTKDALKIQGDKIGEGAFKEFLKDAFTNMLNHMKKGAAFYVWHADSSGDIFRNACTDTGLQVRQCLIWKKNCMVLGRQDYQWIHEPCLYGWKDGAAHYFIDDRANVTVYEDKLDINKLNKEQLKDIIKEILEGKISTTVISEDKPSRSTDHPTMKPVKLMGRLIKNSSKPGHVVLDLFGGSGTTLIAADQLGRTCYMSEIDPRYCDVIIKRWEKQSGDQAEILHNIQPAA